MSSLSLLPLDVFRALLLLIPATVLAYSFSHQALGTRRWTSALFAYIWQFQWRLMLFTGGIQLGLWTFDTEQMLLMGVPADIMLGASLLLGALPAILLSKLSVTRLIPALVISDLLLIYLFMPLIGLSMVSFVCLLVVSILVITPSQLLARWTVLSQHIYLRSTLQNISWAVLLLWLFPSVLFHLTADSWNVFLARDWLINCLYLSVLLLPTIIITNALYVFAKYGKGTGFPYDAPIHLVTTGVYRYVSNPMQIGIVLLMAFWGMILSSGLLMLTAPIALVLFIVFKNVCNGSCQIGESDPNWQAYQRNTPKWIPFNFRTR